MLRLDGSPPLFYLLLHGWMALAGSGEAATRAPALLFALLAVPVSWWAGTAVFGPPRGRVRRGGRGRLARSSPTTRRRRACTRSSTVLSVLACASFALAFLHGRRGHVWLLGVWVVLLLYTHNWALFLVAGLGTGWLWLWRQGRVDGRDGALLAAGVALAYAPWVPSLVFQAANTAAPWAERPSPLYLLGIPGGLFGYAAFAAAGAGRRVRARAARCRRACGCWR